MLTNTVSVETSINYSDVMHNMDSYFRPEGKHEVCFKRNSHSCWDECWKENGICQQFYQGRVSAWSDKYSSTDSPKCGTHKKCVLCSHPPSSATTPTYFCMLHFYNCKLQLIRFLVTITIIELGCLKLEL